MHFVRRLHAQVHVVLVQVRPDCCFTVNIKLLILGSGEGAGWGCRCPEHKVTSCDPACCHVAVDDAGCQTFVFLRFCIQRSATEASLVDALRAGSPSAECITVGSVSALCCAAAFQGLKGSLFTCSSVQPDGLPLQPRRENVFNSAVAMCQSSSPFYPPKKCNLPSSRFQKITMALILFPSSDWNLRGSKRRKSITARGCRGES